MSGINTLPDMARDGGTALGQQLFNATQSARIALPPAVYPGYIAVQIKKALKSGAADPEQIIREVGDMETVGDCKYAIPLTDFNGTEYRIVVEVRS